MQRCKLLIFAADHGIADAGVSAFPQAVTQQMVRNFLHGGAAANVFATNVGVPLTVIDAGIAGDAIIHDKLISHRLGSGTANSVAMPAMTETQLSDGIRIGRMLAEESHVDALCIGEMGIGNTSSATLICHKMLGLDLGVLTGRGTGVDEAGLAHKTCTLRQAASRTNALLNGENAMREYGGFEIVMMCGAILGAAASQTVVIIDGFIATAAALVAIDIDPTCKDALVFAHQSAEEGHQHILRAMKSAPLLSLCLRLGEGTGSLLAWPLVKCAAAMLNDMASFDSAGVSGRP